MDNLSNFEAPCEFSLFCAALRAPDAFPGLTSTMTPWGLCPAPSRGASLQRYSRALGGRAGGLSEHPPESRGPQGPRGVCNTGLLQLAALVREGCCRTVFPQRTQAAKHPPMGVRSPRRGRQCSLPDVTLAGPGPTGSSLRPQRPAQLSPGRTPLGQVGKTGQMWVGQGSPRRGIPGSQGREWPGGVQMEDERDISR